MRLVVAIVLAFAALLPSARADDKLAIQQSVAQAIAPSLVRVEFRLKEDRGELPGWSASSGRVSTRSMPSSGEQLIEEERPLEAPGFLLAPDLVLAHDPELPARFVASITVRYGGESAAATPVAWAKEDGGVFLKLDHPLAGAKPLTFTDGPSGPDAKQFAVHWGPGDGDWSLVVREASTTLDVESPDATARTRAERGSDNVIVDEKGNVRAIYLIGRAATDETRPADPRRWPQVDAAAMKDLFAQCTKRAEASVLQVSLSFRSPRKAQQQARMTRMRDDEDGVGTELETLGVLLGDGNVLVLAELDPKATARLETITLHDADGKEHRATFVASLRDWGAFIAKAPSSLSGGTALTKDEIVAHRDQLLPVAHVRTVGRSRLSDPTHLRLQAFRPGFRNIQFPYGNSNDESAFVFLPSGELLGVPLTVRGQPGQERTWRSATVLLCGGSVVNPLLANLSANSDASNVPLSEADESRTGWLGAMLQPLGDELARANNVAEFTRDGQFGGLVTYVYPDSPAAKAGIEPGAILLDVRTTRRQKPIEIRVGPGDLGFRGIVNWDQLDDLPEEYYDQLTAPWPPIDDTLARTLTELGIGSTYELEYVQDGKQVTKKLTVEQSPPHYGNAPKFESKELGLTVRDLTLEIRQYFSLEPNAPGVVVAKLEPGQRASVAGLRPLEIITHVDDAPVTDAAEFGKLIADKKDLKLTVKRATKERVVRVSLEQ